MTAVDHSAGCLLAGSSAGHSTAAKRVSDAVNLHVAALGPWEAKGKWVAVRLANGRSDGTLYDTRRDAVRHQSDERLCAYVCVQPSGMSVCDAESFLSFHRKAYGAGFRLTDPDHQAGGRDVIRPVMAEQARAYLASLRRR